MGSGSGVRLAARLVSNPLFWLTDLPAGPGLRQAWFVNVVPVDPLWSSFAVSEQPGHPNFPYGIAVEPD
jgi:hypothetical protein